MLLRPGHLQRQMRQHYDCLRERSSGVFLELCGIKSSGEGDIILIYMNFISFLKNRE
jgi:hypothetical protein